MTLLDDTSTVHLKNVLPLKRNEDPLEFPGNSTDTQPPPATALCDLLRCGEPTGTTATARFSAIVQPVTLMLTTSKAATAPPHVEQGSLDREPPGHPPPIAVLCVKLLLRTWRNRPRPGPLADTAPPLAALQLIKRHCDTATLLSIADKAPPLPLTLKQFWNVMPVKVTVELNMLKAASEVCTRRRLQSKKVADGTPLITTDSTLLMLTVFSLNTPEMRFT
jgi:hypothetical protein